jgi:hypothetical protein
VSRRAALAAAVPLALLAPAPGAEARTNCSYAGPPANRLTVTGTRFSLGDIRRRGDEIEVAEFLERPERCRGGTPTVFNTDAIRVVVRGALANVDIRLDGGLPAPGVTPEAEGAPEIEIEYSGPLVVGDVVGTRRDDELHWGPARGRAGLNLNPGSAGDRDVDVTMRGGTGVLGAEGGLGDDRIVPGPGGPIADEPLFAEGGGGQDVLATPATTSGSLEGERGNDTLTGGRSLDFLRGGPGDDRIFGAGGADELGGGPGRDVLVGGPGQDRIDSSDGRRELVRCGPGRDVAIADPGDRLLGCEVVHR